MDDSLNQKTLAQVYYLSQFFLLGFLLRASLSDLGHLQSMSRLLGNLLPRSLFSQITDTHRLL
jgi:hypothetical protein